MVSTRLAPARLPPGRRIYAIGDVHGCDAALAALHARITEDLRARPMAHATLVHLGDYIDRGPDSAGVVARLMGPALPPVQQVVNLMGNHEQLLLGAIDGADPAMAGVWLANGGPASLRSWGVPVASPPAHWRGLLPAPQIEFLRKLGLTYRDGGYLFVHAGLRPGIPAARQSTEDLLWIREPFLSWEGDHGAVVVHGHTPRAEPELRANRIGIDTGAVLGGKLTCAVLEADRVGFLHSV